MPPDSKALNRRPKLLVVIGLTATVALAAGIFLTQERKSATTASDQRAEGPALDVAFTYWDGESGSTADFRGRPLVVNFWASWCFSCLAEIPEFVKVFERHRSEVDFLGLNLQDDPSQAGPLAIELGITYQLGRDPDGRAFAAFDALAMPTTVFIDAEGRVVEMYSGQLSAEILEEKLVKLL